MSLDEEKLKKDYISNLSNDGFKFDSMPNHINYDQNEDGTVKLDADGSPSIIKEYDEPSMSLILDSIAKGTTENVNENLSINDLNDVTITDPRIHDFLVYDGTKWVNMRLSNVRNLIV